MLTRSALFVPILALFLTVSFTPSTAVAQGTPMSDTEGIFLRLNFNYTTWDLNDTELFGDFVAQGGPGFGFEFGYGASNLVALFMAFDAANIENEDSDSYTLVHLDLGVLLHLMNSTSKFRPYGKFALTVRTAEFDSDVVAISTFGPAFTAGAGLKYFLTEKWALNIEGLGSFGSMTEITIGPITLDDVSIGARSGRLNLGVTWFP